MPLLCSRLLSFIRLGSPLMLSERREPSVPHLLGGWLPHPEHRVRRGFLMHAAASLATLLHGNETVNVSRLREQEVQKPDLLIPTRSRYLHVWYILKSTK